MMLVGWLSGLKSRFTTKSESRILDVVTKSYPEFLLEKFEDSRKVGGF